MKKQTVDTTGQLARGWASELAAVIMAEYGAWLAVSPETARARKAELTAMILDNMPSQRVAVSWGDHLAQQQRDEVAARIAELHAKLNSKDGKP